MHADTLALRVGDLVTLGDRVRVLHADAERERVGDRVKEGEGVVLEDLLGERDTVVDTDIEVVCLPDPVGNTRD